MYIWQCHIVTSSIHIHINVTRTRTEQYGRQTHEHGTQIDELQLYLTGISLRVFTKVNGALCYTCCCLFTIYNLMFRAVLHQPVSPAPGGIASRTPDLLPGARTNKLKQYNDIVSPFLDIVINYNEGITVR